MEIIIALLALEAGLINPAIFVALTLMAVVSAMVAGPLVKLFFTHTKEPALKEIFPPEAIVVPLAGKDREEVIKNLAHHTASMVALDKRKVAQAVLEREAIMSTGLEEGIAIPHAYLETLNRHIMIFGYHLEGVDWDTLDDKPVHYVVLLLSPQQEQSSQVTLLALITRTLSQEEVRSKLKQTSQKDVFYNILLEALDRTQRKLHKLRMNSPSGKGIDRA